MAQKKVKGVQLNIPDVAAAVAADPSALSTIEGSIDHANLGSGIGTNTHVQIDTHIADTDLHVTADQSTFLDALNLGGSPVQLATEVNYLDGVTSNVQAQLDAKVTNLVDDTSPQLGGSLDLNGQDIHVFGSPAVAITPIEMSYLDGLTGLVQANLDTKLENIVEDTTPQLGGNLDVNDFDIVGAPAATATSNGGQIDILAGDGGATSGSGGAINITAGDGTTSGAGGDLKVTAGTGTSVEGGDLWLHAGAGSNTAGGDIWLRGGTVSGATYNGEPSTITMNGGSNNGAGGAWVFNAGAADSGSGQAGGNVNIQSGNGDGAGAAGVIKIVGGSTGSGQGANIEIQPGGTSGGTDGHILLRRTSIGDTPVETRWYEPAANTNFISFKAPDTLSGDTTWTLPEAQGTVAGSPSIAGVLGIDLGEFTVAGLPAAADYANCWAMATDASGGRTAVRSDGQVWRVIAVEGAQVTT